MSANWIQGIKQPYQLMSRAGYGPAASAAAKLLGPGKVDPVQIGQNKVVLGRDVSVKRGFRRA